MFQKEQEVAVMKSNFFSNISHEFRTPLTLILGPIQLLKEKVNDTKLKYHLDTMQRSANRLLSLINQLLDLSKLESGKLELNKKEINMASFIKGITMTFESLVETKSIQLSAISSAATVLVNIDPEKLETIMINLLTNSFNYTPENGKISVSVDTIEGKNGQKVCQISVEDNGSGIPQEEIKNVFNKYYQSTAPDDGESKGYGIGLALTKELVELHEGSIKLFSEPGKGTEVVLKFPAGNGNKTMQINDRKKALLDENPVSRNIGPLEDLQDSSKERPIILLIEDNRDVMFYLEDIVGEKYQILKANNGAIGIEMALEHIPDLIISDVMMPIKDGFEVCETLKLDEKTSHVPIILLTAKASLDDKIKGLNIKADEYLTKPFVPKELLIRIKNLIRSRRELRERYNKELILRPDDVYVSSIDEKFLKKVKQVVEEYLGDETFNMEKLGEGVGMSRSQIHRKLHALTDQSATQFIRSYRLNRAIDLVRQNAASISEIAYTVGFGDPSYFSKCFHEEFGMTPREAQNTPK
ncbi:MAG TPA: ATP-binding protein [Salinimicrobium sp.]|nr:ATP-binding protein [Salinimicrobium sp.]